MKGLIKPREYSKIKTSKAIVDTSLVVFIGLLLGIFSKWLDTLGVDTSTWYGKILEVTNLNNIFSSIEIWILLGLVISIFSSSPFRAGLNTCLFFLAMCFSYHMTSIFLAGFNPSDYMIKWYMISIACLVIGFASWYAYGKDIIAIILSSIIIVFSLTVCFSIGLWYFYIIDIFKTLIFIGILIILHTNIKKSVCSLLVGVILAYIIKLFI